MNQLFLKIRTNKYYILWLILSFYNGILANDSIPDNKFLEYCRNSDAYMQYAYTDVVYFKTWGNYKREFTVQNKLVVNNKSGVEQYAFLNLTNYVSDHLKEIKIKTLKSDGTVIELDTSQVFAEHIKNGDLGTISYPIPGVEPGDTIETYYVYTESLNDYALTDFVNLYSSVPSLNMEYTVRTPPNLKLKYRLYHGFPEPKVMSNDTLIYVLFKMENVKGISENRYTCLPCELPYLYYSIEEKESETKTWKDIYNQEFNFITQPIKLDYEKLSFYKRWKRGIIGEVDDSSKFYKFNLLHQNILENFRIDPANGHEMFKSSGYFLKEKHFDPISIRRLYRQILEDLGIKYWAVFGRSKRKGQIDPFNVRKGEYDHIFFAFENDQGSLNLLYPHDIFYKYQIGEIPTSLYNTTAVVATPYLTEKIKKKDKFISYDLKMAEVDSVIVNIIKLPGMTPAFNYLKQIVYCDVDLKEKKTTFKSRFMVSGGLSTDVRSFYSQLNQDKETRDFYDALAEFEGDNSDLGIDTITQINLNTTLPFVYKINAEGSLKKSLVFLNDSLISITLDNLIQHSQIESEKDSIDLNYYLDYCYSDFIMLILSFPCDIEVVGIDSYNKNIENTLGTYLFQIKQVGKNNLSLQSNYKIIKDMIPKNEYSQLNQLNELVKEIKNIHLLIKLKNI